MSGMITIEIAEYNQLVEAKRELVLLWDAVEQQNHPLHLIKCAADGCPATMIHDGWRGLEVCGDCKQMQECSAPYELPPTGVESECSICYCDKHLSEFKLSSNDEHGYVCRDCSKYYDVESANP